MSAAGHSSRNMPLVLFVLWMVWSAAYKLFWIAVILAAVVVAFKLRGFFKKNN